MEKFNLNEAQKTAISHNKGPMLVLAGPGSGKTTVIVNRIEFLIKNYNVNSREILVITFTKSAAEEMKTRFNKLSSNNGVFFGTFHSYFFKIIRSFFNYSIENVLTDIEQQEILKSILNLLKISINDEEDFLQNIINDISLLKNELISPNLYNPYSCNYQDFINILNKYEEIKKDKNKVDFNDMLINCYELLKNNKKVKSFWQNKYKYILIDEFQDINKVQYECIKLLVNDEKNIFVVGDDDQSIYKFRGARPDFLLNFTKDFKNSKKTVLNINYRSTEKIISLCNNIILVNKNRIEKNIIGTNKKGSTPILIRPYNSLEESKFIIKKIKQLSKSLPLEEIAIIYRTNIQGREIIEGLSDNNINYQIKDTVFSIYDHFIAKDILAYLTLSLNNYSNDSFLRIVNKPKRYISKLFLNESLKNCKNSESVLKYINNSYELKTYQLEKIHDLVYHLKNINKKSTYDAINYIFKKVGYEDYLQDYADFKRIKVKNLFNIFYEVLEASKKHPDILDFLNNFNSMSKEIKKHNKNKSGVVISTIHSAKGLEFDTVFIVSCIEGFMPHERAISNEDIEEERRLFYVGATRAKSHLYISAIKSKYEQKVKQSRFLDDLTKKGG